MGKREIDGIVKPKLFFNAVLGGNIDLNGKKEDKNRTKCPKKRLQLKTPYFINIIYKEN
jgi:hypothetical protein